MATTSRQVSMCYMQQCTRGLHSQKGPTFAALRCLEICLTILPSVFVKREILHELN